MSDFHKKVRKCSHCRYLVCVKIWSHLHDLNKSYTIFHFFQVCMEIYRKSLPTPHKTPLTFFLSMLLIQNLQEMCKTKIHSYKNRRGPSVRANFSISYFFSRGVKFTPPPCEIGLRGFKSKKSSTMVDMTSKCFNVINI